MVRPWNVVAVILSVEGMSGVVVVVVVCVCGGGGGGYERWLTPFVRECAGMPQKKCLIQDVCRSDSNAF